MNFWFVIVKLYFCGFCDNFFEYKIDLELEISMDNSRIILKNDLLGFSSRNAFSALFVCAIQNCIVSFAVSQYVYLIISKLLVPECILIVSFSGNWKIPCLRINIFIPKIDNNSPSESSLFQCHSSCFWY